MHSYSSYQNVFLNTQLPVDYNPSLPPYRHQQSFHGIDVSALHVEAVEEYFKQPIVDTFDIRILMSRPIGHSTDFSKAQEQDLHK